MKETLLKFLDKRKIVYEQQNSFQKGKSKTLAIFDLYIEITRALDKTDYASSVLLGFSKAFGSVNHNALLKKLENYGIRVIADNLFQFYLNRRNEKIKKFKHLIFKKTY